MNQGSSDLPASLRGIDWAALAARHDAAPLDDDADWLAALDHFDEDPSCHDEAMAADPLLLFRRMHEEAAPVDAADIRRGVGELRRAAAMGGLDASDGFESPSPLHRLRSVVATSPGLAVAASALIAGALWLSPTEDALVEPGAPSASPGTASFERAALETGTFDTDAFDTNAFDTELDAAIFEAAGWPTAGPSAWNEPDDSAYTASGEMALAAFDPSSLPAVEELVDDSPWFQIDDAALTLVVVQADL